MKSDFEWLTQLTFWGDKGDGEEVLELSLADLVNRSNSTRFEWQFEFVSWASARLIRTGEWYEIVEQEFRHGIEVVSIIRDLGVSDLLSKD